MPFDVHPDLTIEELIFIKEMKEAFARLVKEHEERLETQRFAFQFELDKIEESYNEVVRESDKREDVMRRLVMATQNPEQISPIQNPEQYSIPERPAMDRIDLMEVMSERQQAIITMGREELQKFQDESQQELKDMDKKIAIILQNFAKALRFIDGMQYKVIELPNDFDQNQI